MVESKTVINIEGRLVIFPLYTYYLQSNGCRVTFKQDKQSDRKLNEMLMKANIAEALNKEYVLPHIMIFDGQWKTLKCNGKPVALDAGVYGKYTYYPTLVEQGVSDAMKQAIACFVKQYSSAKINVVI